VVHTIDGKDELQHVSDGFAVLLGLESSIPRERAKLNAEGLAFAIFTERDWAIAGQARRWWFP
jgi:hypothetical protein